MSNNRSINPYLKTNSQDNIKKEGTLDNSEQYKHTKQQMRSLCVAFSVPSSEYASNKIIQEIEDYLKKSLNCKSKLNTLI